MPKIKGKMTIRYSPIFATDLVAVTAYSVIYVRIAATENSSFGHVDSDIRLLN